ncbi:helix-turn-helix domain-containing protein [Bradyrhizobium sp. 147]|uniref:helix-turn-helix domain-containing protein n=1 Tax=Bradyrhizobium sp. 147 TaxID=2782623 RepID=UPI0032078A14
MRRGHLARLFEWHVGATPQQLAKTLRAQRAKRLLDAGDYTMAEIAFQAASFMVARRGGSRARRDPPGLHAISTQRAAPVVTSAVLTLRGLSTFN